MLLVSGGETRLVPQTGRGRGIAAAISGAFAFAWFGWATDEVSPSPLMDLFQIGRGLGVLTVILGILLAVRSPAQTTPMTDRAVGRRYGIVVGLEFALLGLGNVVLANRGLGAWIPVWVCAGVGVHFIPLSRIFGERSMLILGVLMTAVAVAALIVGLTLAVATSTVTGAGAGLCLLVFAGITLIDKRIFASPPPGTR